MGRPHCFCFYLIIYLFSKVTIPCDILSCGPCCFKSPCCSSLVNWVEGVLQAVWPPAFKLSKQWLMVHGGFSGHVLPSFSSSSLPLSKQNKETVPAQKLLKSSLHAPQRGNYTRCGFILPYKASNCHVSIGCWKFAYCNHYLSLSLSFVLIFLPLIDSSK